jgi:hypothetical protein
MATEEVPPALRSSITQDFVHIPCCIAVDPGKRAVMYPIIWDRYNGDGFHLI